MEPLLTQEDRRIWMQWERAAGMHARTLVHARVRDKAQGAIATMLDRCGREDRRAWVSWSGGKDSTVMTHLIHGVDPSVPVMSEKDDLDFPGEETYVRDLATAWGGDLRIVRPPFALQDWIKDHGSEISEGDNIHSRAAALSKVAFYGVIEAARQAAGVTATFLGLRAEESRGRRMNRQMRGLIYTKGTTGELIGQPLADWRALDVYAYAQAHEIPLLPLYRCVRLAESPDRIRKSWWLPGAAACEGGSVWLKAYWPSLYRRVRELLPQFGAYA